MDRTSDDVFIHVTSLPFHWSYCELRYGQTKSKKSSRKSWTYSMGYTIAWWKCGNRYGYFSYNLYPENCDNERGSNTFIIHSAVATINRKYGTITWWCNSIRVIFRSLIHCPAIPPLSWMLRSEPVLEMWLQFLICYSQTHIKDGYLDHFWLNWPRDNATRLHWWLVNIGRVYGLVSSGNKPLSEPMMTQIFVPTRLH